MTATDPQAMRRLLLGGFRSGDVAGVPDLADNPWGVG